jgi:hypothetical protein
MKLARSFKPIQRAIQAAEIIGDTGRKLRTTKMFFNRFSSSHEMESL